MNKKHPKVLIISDASWRDDNNIGNTFNDIFKSWPKENLAMIYGRPDLPSTKMCDTFFQFSEVRMIKRIFNRKIKVGRTVKNEDLLDKGKPTKRESKSGSKLYSFFRRFRFNIFLTLRELLWKTFSFEDEDFYQFIDDFDPEIIFNLATPGVYMNKIQQNVLDYKKRDSYIYFVDDLYTLKQFSLSPVYWVNRFSQRRAIIKTLNKSDHLYVISDLMKEEYEKAFKREAKILTKQLCFKEEFENKQMLDMSNLKFVYTGNLIYGRFEVLLQIGESLDIINNDLNTKHHFDIYSATELSKIQLRKLDFIKSICFKGKVLANEAVEKQKSADILVHVESFQLKQKLLTRLSFSTKLVDYFKAKKCIFAVGSIENASIDYLFQNNAAIVAQNRKIIFDKLIDLVCNEKLISKTAKNSYKLGKLKHNLATKSLKDELYRSEV